MKKIVSLILIFLMLAALCGCETPIANDYVRGYKAKVDNDITFVYTQGAFYPDTGYLINHYYEKELTYKEFAEVYGNKIIHESVRDDEIYYYTVYFGDNNDAYYLVLEKNEKGEGVYDLSEDKEVIFDNGNTVRVKYKSGYYPEMVVDKICYFNKKGRYIKIKGKTFYLNSN